MKSQIDFTRVPKSWRDEITNECTNVAKRIMDNFGPLGVLLFIRIDNLTKEDLDMFDLSMLNINNDGMKFISRVLGFFNYNFKQAKRQKKCLQKVKKLVKLIPPISQLKKAFRSNPP